MRITQSICAFALAVVGCAQLPDQTREIVDRLIIRNESSREMRDVVLRVPATQTVLKTNRILPRSEYAVGFSSTRNPRHAATLTWNRAGQLVTRQILTDVTTRADNLRPHKIVISVTQNDQIKSRIEPSGKP